MGVSARPVSAGERQRAENHWASLSPVAEKLGVLSQLPLSELEELIEQMQARGSIMNQNLNNEMMRSSSNRCRRGDRS